MSALLASVATPAIANDAIFRFIQYEPRSQPIIYCPAGLLCEITFEPGERVRDGLNAQVPLWDPHLIYEGTTPQTPHLVVKPDAPDLTTNVVITTDRRTYHLMLMSTHRRRAVYVEYRYDDERRARARELARYERAHPQPTPPPTPMPVTAQIDLACASMPASDAYDTDSQPANLRPLRTCHSIDHTYIQLGPTGTVPTDVPILVEPSPDGDRVVNYTYDAPSRVFRVDGVGYEYALILGSGKGAPRLRIRRVIRKPSSGAGATPSAAASTPIYTVNDLDGQHGN
ncbi:MAG: TrbG/VirB9 family P-type conjugative transfer protein [Vulcanimicrobiaceae bacterium]